MGLEIAPVFAINPPLIAPNLIRGLAAFSTPAAAPRDHEEQPSRGSNPGRRWNWGLLHLSSQPHRNPDRNSRPISPYLSGSGTLGLIKAALVAAIK